MINRRQVIQSGIAATLVSTAPAFAADRESLLIYKMVYDARFPEAAAFADEGRCAGIPLAAFSGDITSVWFHDLYNRWKTAPAPVAGLTDHAAWFVLDMMARGEGLRTVYLAHHASSSAGWRHAVFGPREAMRQAAFDAAQGSWSPAAAEAELSAPRRHLADRGALESSGAAWPRVAARLIMAVPTPANMSRERSTILDASSRSIGSAELVSWVIASPRRT
jgi:hypothetical protein